MRIQFISFQGCPNAPAARAALDRALSAARVRDRVEDVDASAPETPEPLRSWGSPTILLDGEDVGGRDAPTGPGCRLYTDDAGHVGGAPTDRMIRAAVRRAIAAARRSRLPADARERTRRTLRTGLFALVAGAGLLLIVRESIASLQRCGGPSDAPTLRIGQVFLVHRAAYDVRLPGPGTVLWRVASPRVGDLVLFEIPGRGQLATKRVVAGPGDVVELRANHLVLNGRAAAYATLDRAAFSGLAEANAIGATVERETLGEVSHWVTFTIGANPLADMPPVRIPGGHYFLLGDNRDHSLDSRAFGPVPREALRGRVLLGRAEAQAGR